MAAEIPIQVTVNGVTYSRNIDPRVTASDFLREELRLTGTHVGCEHGVCGACTVLLDGVSVRSCILFAVQLDDREVTTVEGLAGDGELSPLQAAFVENHALQCGFCTPGFLLRAQEFLVENDSPTREEVRQAVSGNLCRCTSYEEIVNAVMAASQHAKPETPLPDSHAAVPAVSDLPQPE